MFGSSENLSSPSHCANPKSPPLSGTEKKLSEGPGVLTNIDHNEIVTEYLIDAIMLRSNFLDVLQNYATLGDLLGRGGRMQPAIQERGIDA